MRNRADIIPNMGKVVGTNGETYIRIVTDAYNNNIVTAFPIP